MKKLVTLLLCLTFSFSVLPALAESTPTSVTVAVGGDPSTMSPYASFNTGRLAIIPEVYQTLFLTDGFGGEFYGVLARSYEIVDGFNYIVYLYDNIYDSNGNHFTASDVAFCIDECKSWGNQSGCYYVDHCTVIDDYTVQLTFVQDMQESMGLFEDMCINMYMVTKASYEASGDDMAYNAVGTGPYVISEWVQGSNITLTKNERYWQTNPNSIAAGMFAQNVDEIHYQFITDASQVAIALETGAADMSHEVAAADIKLFAEGGSAANRYTLVREPQHMVYFTQYNGAESSVCSNENLRKAIAYCWDAASICVGAFQKNAEVAYVFGGNPKYADYLDEWDGRDYFGYNLDAAKEYLGAYLKETNQKASDVTIRLYACNGNKGPEINEVLQGFIMALGLNCTTTTVEAAVINDTMSDSSLWDIYTYNYGSNGYLVNVWKYKLTKAETAWGDSTIGFVKDDYLDEIVTNVSLASGHTTEAMKAVDEYINEKCYMVAICYSYDTSVVANWVKDCYLEKRGWIVPGACTYDWDAKN